MNAQLKAACIAASLVGFWGSAEASTVRVGLIPAVPGEAVDLSSSTGLYQYNQSGDPTNNAARLTSTTEYGIVLAGPTTLPVDDEQAGNVLNTGVQYTFIGVNSKGGLTIALTTGVAEDAIRNKLDWSQVFNGVPGSMTEDEVKTNIQSGAYSPYGFTSFMAANEALFPLWGDVALLVNFSEATFAGTIEATPVPEPGTLVAVGGGLALLGRRRKR